MELERSEFRLRLEEIDLFWEQGFLGPFTLCTSEEASELWARARRDVLTSPGPCLRDECGHPDRHTGRHLDSPMVRDFATRPALVERVRSLLGPGLLLFLSRFWIKNQGSPELPWHQDSTYWPIYPKVAVTAWTALTPAHRGNGCLNVIPRSHLQIVPQGKADDSMGFELMSLVPEEDLRRAVPLELQPGQFYLFDVNTLHQSNANLSAEPRVGLQVSFAPQLVKIPRDWFFEGHQSLLVGDAPGMPEINRVVRLQEARGARP